MKNVMLELELLRAKHKKPGRSKAPRVRANFPNLKVESSVPLSNTITTGGHKRDKTTDHKWKRGCEEKPETIAEIEAKKKRIRPLYGKGADQYATDGDNSGPIRVYQKGV
jgi:hypothetical protein